MDILNNSLEKIIKIKNFRKKFHIKPVILFVSVSTTMDEHLLSFYHALNKNKYKCKFVFFNDEVGEDRGINTEKYKNYNLKKSCIIKSLNEYLSLNPDLVVLPDLWFPKSEYFSAKTIYTNHGITTICWGEPTTDYSYHHEKPIFDKYLECSKHTYDFMKQNKNYSDCLVYVGHKHANKFRNLQNKRDEFRESLNIKPNQKAVFMLSSWRDTSLFHQLGKEVFKEIKKLAKNNNYKFIVSIHPNEYIDYGDSYESFGKYVDELEKFGVIVRKPGEDISPYLFASDIVVTDHTSTTYNAIMAEKNIIFSNFNDNILTRFCGIYRLKQKLPTINYASQLESMINMPYPKECHDEILKIKSEIDAPDGFYSKTCNDVVEELLMNFRKNSK